MRHFALAVALLAASAARAEGDAPATPAPPAAPAAAPAQAKPRHVWELDLFAGYGQLAYPALDTSTVDWSNGGPGFALAAAYRGPHFTHPFFEISYVPFVSSGRSVALPGSPSTLVTNSTWAWGLVLGPGWDIDWFRFRAGIGLYDVFVKTTLNGQSNTASQLSVGFLASAAAFLWRPEPFGIGLEARLAALQSPFSGIYQVSWEIGLTGRWDFSRH